MRYIKEFIQDIWPALIMGAIVITGHNVLKYQKNANLKQDKMNNTGQMDLFESTKKVNKLETPTQRLQHNTVEFDGAAYIAEFDYTRLKGQMLKIWNLMHQGGWYTLQEISINTGAPEASASAQLRNFRKLKFGQHTVERRRRGDVNTGLFEYRLVVNENHQGHGH